jgi:hypothetical protein
VTELSDAPLHLAQAIQYHRDAARIEVAGALLGQAGQVAAHTLDMACNLLAALVAADGAACLALYGLQLAADTQAGELSSAAARLASVRLGALSVAAALDQALERRAAEHAEPLTLAIEQAQRTDRAAERCGRRAAELLDTADVLVAHLSCGLALGWMQQQARQSLGVVPQLRQELAAAPDATLLLVGAESLALDGSATVIAAVAHGLAHAARQALPRYLIAPAGPVVRPAPASEYAPQAGLLVVAPSQISAIVTDRGLYRPEMLARYLGDGGAPQDVIPLH